MNPLLLPLVACQGVRVKRDTIRLPEAEGPRCGRVGDGPALRLSVVGESTAAGCGVLTHDEGMAGQLARALVSTGLAPGVEWSVTARNGATASAFRRSLLPGIPDGVDLTVVLLGVNDVLARTPPSTWRTEVGGLLDVLRSRSTQVVLTGIPPFDAFPSLPATLARFLREHADRLNAVTQQLAADLPQVIWVGGEDLLPLGPDFFGADGFHPSADGYRRWAASIAGQLVLSVR